MDIKLKNRHRLAVVLIINTIFWAAYITVGQYSYWYADKAKGSMEDFILIAVLAVAACAWIYPCIPFLQTGEEKIFQMPFEMVLLVSYFVVEMLVVRSWYIVESKAGAVRSSDLFYWCGIFGLVYWASSCIRPIYKLGGKGFWRECTILGNPQSGVRKAISNAFHSVKQIDFTKKNDKAILKIILANGLLLFLLCLILGFEIRALVVYSIILFFYLRKCYYDVQEKYEILLKATSKIANGNLDKTMEEDLWIFNPLKEELMKVQHGFKNAVEKEVKSQHMRTELITNVSHDLKTPLTAIITYVDLLKMEKVEERRQEYIEILERKAGRLKALIEDLFAISKASSHNIELNLVEVDLVYLFKQVMIELEEQIQDAKLDFRCSYPEEKIFVLLDSQTTYRIFENLLINIVKYAMPRTRVYIEIYRKEAKVIIRMKNVSAAELNFNPEEITERFVRGDLSRNTEGSGLGLAIAKSFTEIQKGEFKVETEADLFKVEIGFDISESGNL